MGWAKQGANSRAAVCSWDLHFVVCSNERERRMAKSVRLIDIGKKLNVSAVTVSKALSGQKGVSEEMRGKIVRLADEMGYERSATQMESAKGKSYTIGVIVADRFFGENQSFYWKLYQEISRQAISRNGFPILEVISREVEENKELPKVVLEKKADGLIVMGEFKHDYMEFLADHVALPMVNLDTTGRGKVSDCVVSNNMMGGYGMTNYLFEKGHRNIGFVGTRLATTSIDDRYFGYLKSLMEHGVKPREDWILEDRDRESGFVDMQDELQLPKEMPTAFFCNCDSTASLMIQKLLQDGYSVPGDVSIVGFDNYMPDQFGGIALTTYDIDTKEMARRTVHIVLHKLRNDNYSTGIFMLPGKIVERDSVRQIAPAVPFV